jgi:hypothetical protein
MKKGQLSKERMVKILREADHAPVAELAEKHGISDPYSSRPRPWPLQPMPAKALIYISADISAVNDACRRCRVRSECPEMELPHVLDRFSLWQGCFRYDR